MNVVDSVEIRVHPLNVTRVLRDARERGAKVTRLDAGWTIDNLPVVEDPHVDAGDGYAVSYSGGDFWR